MKTERSIFQKLYITLDDSAEYGLNAQQAKQIMAKVK